MQGQLIILEGPDGAGKTTAARLLVEKLRADGEQARVFAFPGNEPGTLGKLVYDLHHDPHCHGIGHITPASMQVLHAAAHIDAIHTRIQPALNRGDTVIMDRFWWSTIVYGRLEGVDERTLELLEQLARHHWSFITPMAAFILLGPSHELGHREGKAMALHQAYRAWARSLDECFPMHTLDDRGTGASYAQRILAELVPLRRSQTARAH